MKKRLMKKSVLAQFITLLLLTTALALGGCDGDDGAQGPAGQAGAPGPVGPKGPTGPIGSTGQGTPVKADLEACFICHGSGEAGDVELMHQSEKAITADVVVSEVLAAMNGSALEITFNVKTKGVNDDSIISASSAYVYRENPALTERELTAAERSNNVRVSIARAVSGTTVTTPMTLVGLGSGNYKITVPADSGNTDVPADSVPYVFDDAVYLFEITNIVTTGSGSSAVRAPEYGRGGINAAVIVGRGTPPTRNLVSNAGCETCHGEFVFRGTLDNRHHAVPAEYCQVCHVRDDRSFALVSPNGDGTYDTETNAGDGGNLAIYVHGIHNSHAMEDETFVLDVRNSSNQLITSVNASGVPTTESIGFPSSMRNCVSCHVTEDQLAAAVEAPVSFYLCMSCHQSWDGFVASNGTQLIGAVGSELGHHREYDLTTDCMSCHSASAAFDDAGDFHDAFSSSANSFYRGQDVSFANPNEVSFEVTGVTVADGEVTFTWIAEKGGEAVDPCNEVIASGPTFRGLGAYLAYAKGDDWVNDGVGTAPGQPVGTKNLFGTGGTETNPNPVDTTCEANVATTTDLPLSTNAPAGTEKVLLAVGGKPLDQIAGQTYVVRVPSPTYAFNIADGSAVDARRDIVDNAKCLGCHQGTLYQHGGDRVDNTQMCVICHNPSANDKNVRVSFNVVNDNGKVNTSATYDGKTAETYDLRNLIHAIHGAEKREKPIVIYRGRGIYTFVTEDMPIADGWPEDGMTINGSTSNARIAHNRITVHYPKLVNDCEACHYPGTYVLADQSKAVAVTTDAGRDWADQSDDLVTGPNATACASCHYDPSARAHTESQSYHAVFSKDELLELAR